ncbi:MAG TPA: hypothetical protein VN918_04305, partial [Myxococcaceae bacterium]|nr:hypothetical protein [Myxococcaceae bacterium]
MSARTQVLQCTGDGLANVGKRGANESKGGPDGTAPRPGRSRSGRNQSEQGVKHRPGIFPRHDRHSRFPGR